MAKSILQRDLVYYLCHLAPDKGSRLLYDKQADGASEFVNHSDLC